MSEQEQTITKKLFELRIKIGHQTLNQMEVDINVNTSPSSLYMAQTQQTSVKRKKISGHVFQLQSKSGN